MIISGSNQSILWDDTNQSEKLKIYEASAKLLEPSWPTESMDSLLDVAFRGRVLDDPNHPVVIDLLGGI